MRITHKGCAIHLDQCVYLQKVIERCGMLNAKSASTPLQAGYYATKNTEPVDVDLRSRFQTVIGSLLYLMLGTRPDIAFAVTHLLHHAMNPSQDHLNKALYICRYLIGMSTYSLVYNGGSSAGLIACMDSDWGSDPTSRLSQTCFYLKLADGLISWTSCAQKTIAYSSTEAEYMALSDCTRQVTWIQSLLGELGYKLKAIPICGDNQGSIFMASNPVMEPRSKHIDIRYHEIRESVVKGNVELFFIDGAVNPADLLTKNLPHDVEMHASLGAHIPISVRPSLFALLSTATRTQPARELSDAQLGTPDRVLRRSCMSSYSLSLPASVAITWNSFGSVWTSSHYSAQPPAPNPHKSPPMCSLVHLIGSCEGPACVAHPYPFLSVLVTWSSIES